MEKKKLGTKGLSLRFFVIGITASAILTSVWISFWPGKTMAAESINLMMNGGAWLDMARKLVIDPFEKKYGVTVNVTPGSSQQMLTRLKAEKTNSSQDCVIIDLGPASVGYGEGVFEKINPENIPNMKDLDKIAIDKDGYGPIVSAHATGLAYNSEFMKKPIPKSWMDLWNPIYKDTIILNTVQNTSGLLFLLHVSMLNGGSYENIDPGIEMIKKLRPNIRRFVASNSEVHRAFHTEDIIAVCSPSIPIIEARNSGKPINPIFPEEGNVLSPATAQIVRGTKKRELAEKLINEWLNPEAQLGWAVEYNVNVFNKKVKLPADARKRLPSKTVLYDFVKISKNLEKWMEKFTREITM